MKAEIISEKQNPLTHTKVFWVGVEHAGKETPSRHDMFPEVVKKLGSNDELTVIDKIFSERGAARSRVKVLVYREKKEIPKDKLARQERKAKKFLEKRVKKAEGAEKPAEPAAPHHAKEHEKKAEGE
jgi:ribosomal protein S24E